MVKKGREENMPEDSGQNWVVRRYECRVEKQLEKLRNVLEQDVNQMNILLGEKSEWWFDVSDPGLLESESGCEVRKVDKYTRSLVSVGSENTVSFILEKQAIHVKHDGKELFKVQLEWNGRQSHCDLKIDGETYELWEISHIALGPFFFEGKF